MEDKIRQHLAHYKAQMEEIGRKISQQSRFLEYEEASDEEYAAPHIRQALNDLLDQAEVLSIRIDTLEALLR